MKLESIDRLKLRDEFVEAYKQSTGKNILELSKYAKDEYYDPIRKDMRKLLELPPKSTIFSAATFRSFLFFENKLNFSRDTINKINGYIEAVKFPKPKEINEVEAIGDFQNIMNVYKGLGVALLYYRAINDMFDVEISWEAFLKVADYYNGDSEISRKYYNLNLKDSVSKSLLYNIKIEQLLVPYKVVHAFSISENFIDGKLLEEAKFQLTLRNNIIIDGTSHWFNPIINEIIVLLLENQELSCAMDMSNCSGFYQRAVYLADNHKQKILSEQLKAASEYSYKYVEKRLHNILGIYYSEAEQNMVPKIWATRVLYLMILFPLENYCLFIIIKEFLQRGSNSIFLKEIYNELEYIKRDEFPAKLKEIKHRLKERFLLPHGVPEEYYREKRYWTYPYIRLD